MGRAHAEFTSTYIPGSSSSGFLSDVKKLMTESAVGTYAPYTVLTMHGAPLRGTARTRGTDCSKQAPRHMFLPYKTGPLRVIGAQGHPRARTPHNAHRVCSHAYRDPADLGCRCSCVASVRKNLAGRDLRYSVPVGHRIGAPIRP